MNPEIPAATRRRLFLAVFPSIMLPMFLAVMDQTIVATALAAIASELGEAERVSWVVITYLIATTIVAPVYGRLSDSFGRRRLMLIALAIFIIASLLCSLARTIEMLILARALQGVGGGGLMVLSQALVGETIRPRERGRVQGYLAAIVVSASTFGPVAGGLLTQYLGWRAVFFVSVPLAAVAFLLALRLPARSGSGHLEHFDTIGLVLLVAFIAPLLVSVEQLQRLDASTTPFALVLATCAIIALPLLIWRERQAPVPLLPLSLLSRATVWRTNALAACHGAALISLTTFVPIYLRVVHAATPADAGLMLLPVTVGIGIGSIITGRLVTRTGRTAAFPTLGLIVVALTLVCLAYGAPDLSTFQLAAGLAITAAFMGTTMGVVQVTIQSAAEPALLGAAVASVQLARSVEAALGTATVGAILFGTLSSGGEAAELLGPLLDHGLAALDQLPVPQRVAVQHTVSDGFRNMFLALAAFTGVGTLLAWSIPLRRI